MYSRNQSDKFDLVLNFTVSVPLNEAPSSMNHEIRTTDHVPGLESNIKYSHQELKCILDVKFQRCKSIRWFEGFFKRIKPELAWMMISHVDVLWTFVTGITSSTAIVPSIVYIDTINMFVQIIMWRCMSDNEAYFRTKRNLVYWKDLAGEH